MPAETLTTGPSLRELLEGLADAPAIELRGVAADSRRLGSGFLFLACSGASSHGLDYLDAAIDAGAAAVAYDSSSGRHVTADAVAIPLIPVANLHRHVGAIANRYFDYPSHAVKVAGVTGTNGKTTVAWLIAQCLERLGRSCGYSGTLGYGVSELAGSEEMTSPDAVETHHRLATFRDSGAGYAAIEVSSHALDQHRVDAVRFDTTLFTNLSRDHLDYHGDMRAYGEAKARLFSQHPAEHRIINLDSEFGTQLAARCRDNVITVSTNFDRIANGRPHVFVRSVVANEDGSAIRLQSSWGDGKFVLPLPGGFNVANAVLALAFLLVDGVSMNDACAALATVAAPPGRMQRVPATADTARVYVDYAHTPAALDVALRALRAHCRGKIYCVFGCGGDRDHGKRPLMGRIAERSADRVVVTSDNPRSEPPEKIIADILSGFANPQRATVIEDRGAAIAWAIANADAHDTVLLAGRGHETHQIVADGRRELSDFAVARGNLDARAPEGGE